MKPAVWTFFGLGRELRRWMMWASKQFPNATAESCEAHLRSELSELVAALDAQDDDELANEAVDVLVLLLQLLGRRGIDVVLALRGKLAVNKSRVWGETNEAGFWRHIR